MPSRKDSFGFGVTLLPVTARLVETGEAKNAFPEFQRFADGLLPGRSLWYLRAAWERLIADELNLWADPNANARFRRIERRARKEFDQGFWWRPGKTLPDRAPDLSAAGG